MINLENKIWIYNIKNNEYELYIDKKKILALTFNNDLSNFTYRMFLNEFLFYFKTNELDKFIENEVEYLRKNKENIIKY